MIGLVAFIRLEGVNIVSSQFSLILIATFFSSIFAQSLLTSFFAPFLAAWESNFLSSFLIPLVSWCCTCAPIFLAHMTRFLEARCLQEPSTKISTGFLSPFRLLLKVSCANIRWAIANHTFSSHIISSNWHFLVWHKPKLSQCSTAQVRNPQGISKLVNKKLIVACLTTASGQFLKRCWHLFAFQWVPCTLFNSIVRTFLATKSFAAGSSMDPCIWHASQSQSWGTSYCQSAVVPNYLETQWVWRAWVGADRWMSLSRGHLDLQGSWGVLLIMTHQSRVCLKRHLKVLFLGLLK